MNIYQATGAFFCQRREMTEGPFRLIDLFLREAIRKSLETAMVRITYVDPVENDTQYTPFALNGSFFKKFTYTFQKA